MQPSQFRKSPCGGSYQSLLQRDPEEQEIDEMNSDVEREQEQPLIANTTRNETHDRDGSVPCYKALKNRGNSSNICVTSSGFQRSVHNLVSLSRIIAVATVVCIVIFIISPDFSLKSSSVFHSAYNDDEDIAATTPLTEDVMPKLQMLSEISSKAFVSALVGSLAVSLVGGGITGNQSISNSQFCPKDQLFEIKTELNIPDLYIEILNNEAKPTTPPPPPAKDITETNEGRWTQENKLKIFVVLHSHNDPGWIKTFENYFETETKAILNNVLKYLTGDPWLKFIWCEISFFNLWWKTLTWEKRLQVKKLVDDKQLEFVGGGWVMHDEAVSHYSSMVTQLMEGHQWLQQHLNYTPRNGWAIDPFGLSSTSSYLLKRTGLKTSVFSRVHYGLSALLKEKRNTEFYWRQPWDLNGTTDVFSYLMPYETYDKGATCGPDHVKNNGVCKLYSFTSEYDPADIKNRSLTLLEQYRKKSLLFHTNNLLMPIGGDFTWGTDAEWESDIMHLKQIFKYISSRQKLNTEIKFATLNEYFEAVHSDTKKKNFPVDTVKGWKPPVFSGDFYVYAQSPNTYWSGFYTSRIFHKSSERQLMTLLRSAQLMYTLMATEISKEFGNLKFRFIPSLLEKIVTSRRILSLFQHHDGITGTSKDPVVKDYATKLFLGMRYSHFVIQQCIHVLQNLRQIEEKRQQLQQDHSLKEHLNLKTKLSKIKRWSIFYDPVMTKLRSDNIWQDNVYPLDERHQGQWIAVLNSLSKERKQVVRVSVSSFNAKVRDSSNVEIPSEVFPVFKYFNKYYLEKNKKNRVNGTPSPVHDDGYLKPETEHFELIFIATMLPLETKHFKIVYFKSLLQERNVSVKVFNYKTFFNDDFKNMFSTPLNSLPDRMSSENETIQISNHHLTIHFNKNGSARSVKVGELLYPLNITFHYYTPAASSGLYIFKPRGPDVPVNLFRVDPIIIVMEGQLQSYVEAWYPNVSHRVTLFNHNGLESYGIDVQNVFDIRFQKNYELMMRISTGIKSGGTFYTDSNGFQMMRRTYRDDLPIQGNYYPIASSAFIEDLDLRMTLLAAQPGGCASLTSGDMEIMLDRRVSYDDYKGAGQGGTDNLKTATKFKIILEKPAQDCSQHPDPQQSPSASVSANHSNLSSLPLLSLEANLHQLSLLHPLLAYKRLGYLSKSSSGNNSTPGRIDYTVSSSSLPCDIHLLGAMPIPKFTDGQEIMEDKTIHMHTTNRSALLFHRMGFDHRFQSSSPKIQAICFADSRNRFGRLKVQNIFGDLFKNEMMRTSLSLSHSDKYYEGSATLVLDPMEIYAFVAYYSGNESSINDYGRSNTTTNTNDTLS